MPPHRRFDTILSSPLRLANRRWRPNHSELLWAWRCTNTILWHSTTHDSPHADHSFPANNITNLRNLPVWWFKSLTKLSISLGKSWAVLLELFGLEQDCKCAVSSSAQISCFLRLDLRSCHIVQENLNRKGRRVLKVRYREREIEPWRMRSLVECPQNPAAFSCICFQFLVPLNDSPCAHSWILMSLNGTGTQGNKSTPPNFFDSSYLQTGSMLSPSWLRIWSNFVYSFKCSRQFVDCFPRRQFFFDYFQGSSSIVLTAVFYLKKRIKDLTPRLSVQHLDFSIVFISHSFLGWWVFSAVGGSNDLVGEFHCVGCYWLPWQNKQCQSWQKTFCCIILI